MTGTEDWENKERVGRFREYVEIVDLLLRKLLTTYTGKYYQLNEATMGPNCVQKPRSPILIGTKGTKMMKIVSRFADTWNSIAFFNEKMEDKSFEIIKEKNKLDKYCNEMGRDPKEIRRSIAIYETKAANNYSSMKLYSSLDIIRDIVKKYTKIGINEIILACPFVKKEIPLFEKIALEVIPELRKKYK